MGRGGRRTTVGRRRGPRCVVRPDRGPYLIAVDTNVLVYAHRRQARQHEAALSALRDLAIGDEPWGLPVFVLGEFLRVVTHPSLFEYPSSVDDALAALDGLLSSPGARLLVPGERYWSVLRETVRDGHATGNLAFDAQIAAVCLEHAVDTILTEDRDFRRFTGLTVRGIEEHEVGRR